ncbi:hypothetical protein ACIO1C_30650 [Streptomyces sp. NPDC087420]
MGMTGSGERERAARPATRAVQAVNGLTERWAAEPTLFDVDAPDGP